MEYKICELSIIIPVYNTEKFFIKCIDSVLDSVKGLDNIEIIVINDGSKGDINDIIKHYINKYKNLIKYIDKLNTGRADTRNLGIKNANGKYITFVDSDDEVDKEYYSEILKTINKEEPDIIICDIESIKGNEKFITHAKNPSSLDERWGLFDISIMPSSCNKVFKKDLFNEQNNFLYGYNYEDLASIPIIMLSAKKIIYIPETFYKYNIHLDSIMHQKFNEKKFQIIDVLEILFDRIEQLNILEEEKNRAKNSVYYQRLYFEMLEPISKLEQSDIYMYSKLLCNKVNKLHKRMKKNNYYKEELYKGRKIKKVYSILIDFTLYNNLPLLLSKIIKNAVYYNNQYINDMWKKHI